MAGAAMALPAAPIGGSTMLDLELDQRVAMGACTFPAGIKAVDQGLSPGLWSGGKLTGVFSGGTGPSLIEEIIGEHLVSFHERIVRNRESGSGFVIAQHNSSIISIIHSRIAHRLVHLSTMEPPLNAIQYLEKLQLLRYFDFAGLAESVAEVSALLFDTSNSSAVQKTVLYIEGIDIAIEDSQRRSGMVHANALLSSLLRTLIHISRTYPCLLILLGLGLGEDSKGDDAIQSAFASPAGNDMKYQPAGALGRTLAEALDVMVVVHNAHGIVTDGSMIVEVIEDRVGGALGQWAVWDSKK